MEEFRLRSRLYCPFLLPVLSERPSMYSAQASCRLPSGRVRVIPTMTARGLCSDGRYYDCPAYRFWRRPARPEPREPQVA